jgi:hypothetical protein
VDVALRCAVAPLLFKRLKESGSLARVPADVRERLRLAYFTGAARNKRLYQELGPVLRRLRSSGIPVVVLKGAYLAKAVYGDVALRPMGDVDVMVPGTEMPRARAVLLDMGGVPAGQSHQAVAGPGARDQDIESLCRRKHHLPPLVVRDLQIEIHWTIVSPTGPVCPDTAGLWHRAQPARVADVDVLALSPEDLLLHLCLHFGYEHRLEGLRSFCDLHETIRRFRGKMGWTQVAERAGEWGASRYVGLILHLVRTVLGTGVPDDAVERLVPGGIDGRLAETARESLLTQVRYRTWVPFSRLLGTRSLGGKVALVMGRIFLSRDEMAAKYPASRDSRHLWSYRVLRFRDAVRVLGDYVLRRSRLAALSRGRSRDVALVNWLKSGKL